jgi:hypothetical protein
MDPNMDPRLQDARSARQPIFSEDVRGARRERESISSPVGDSGLLAQHSSTFPPAAPGPRPSGRQLPSAPSLSPLAAASSTLADAFKFVVSFSFFLAC